MKNIQYQELSQWMQKEEIKPYIELLNRQKVSLSFKWTFDIIVSAPVLLLLSPVFLLPAATIKIGSRGPTFYRQVGVGQYGQGFRVFKFRSMVQDADKKGLTLIAEGDFRITRVGKLVRKRRLDEFSQVPNVLEGAMSLVDPRPEVRKYVDAYESEYLTILSMPPGVTTTANIRSKDENELLNPDDDPGGTCIHQTLLERMHYNLGYLDRISVWQDIRIMVQIVLVVFRR